MAKAKAATIYHNPKCSTSRQVLEMIEAAGYKVEVIEYLKAGWTKPRLKALFAAPGAARESERGGGAWFARCKNQRR